MAAGVVFVMLLLAVAAASPAEHGSCANGQGACVRDEVDEEALLQQARSLREISKHTAGKSTCAVGDHVRCSLDGSVTGRCSGDQCCPSSAGSVTCPSASTNHLTGCGLSKAYDCTGSGPMPTPAPPVPSPTPTTQAPADPTPAPQPTPAPSPSTCGRQPNPPTNWGEGTYIFSPSDSASDIQAKIDAAYSVNGGQDPIDNGQFSDKRFAFLFQPGQYTVDVPVGYYTSVAGLGDHPDKVEFLSEKGVYSTEGAWRLDIGALDTFWRSAENFKSNANHAWWGTAPLGMLWAVSQAAPLRRIHAMHDVWVAQYQEGNDAAGFASGGFMADSKVEGKVQYMSQQQFFTRNVEATDFVGGAWNFVHVGDAGGVPSPVCPGNPAIAVEPTTPTIADKPYIVSDGTKFSLHVPVVKNNTQGPSWVDGTSSDAVIDFENVYVATSADSASTINSMIACQNIKAVVFTAGIYHLDEAIHVSKPDFVVLGLGLATLIPTRGNAAIEVAGGIGGIRLASVMLEAGQDQHTQRMLDWGSADPTLREAPTSVISDLFVRNGGPNNYQTFVDTFVHIKTNNVVGDNLWLWRADHSVQGSTDSSMFPTNNGLIVDGDNCMMYGLMVEHTLKTLTTWNGEGGQTYFYQSELPYGVFDREFGAPGYVGYKVSASVKSHKAVGLGVYTNFYNPVTVENAIEAPSTATIRQAMTVHLNADGRVNHVINGLGGPVQAGTQRSTVCSYPAPVSEGPSTSV